MKTTTLIEEKCIKMYVKILNSVKNIVLEILIALYDLLRLQCFKSCLFQLQQKHVCIARRKGITLFSRVGWSFIGVVNCFHVTL